MDTNLAIVVVIACIAIATIICVSTMAWFTHRERMAAIKAGFNPFAARADDGEEVNT
ncbi:hypothetical protein [Rhizobium phage RHEph12]|nr:hypothetical protein [Rhizobium phage RHEph12]